MEIRPDGLSRRLEILIEKLPEEKRSHLRELLQSLLEPTVKMQVQRDSLERLEEKYVLALEQDSNILDFRPPSERAENQVPKFERRWNLKVPCIIEATSDAEIFRMAFELHIKGSKSIFLSWHDIDPAGRQNPQTLLELAGCTIFIPNVADLQAPERAAILRVLRQEAADKPHIMAGTRVSYSELIRVSGEHSEFIDALSQAYLKLTKPVHTYKREGLMRYFLESLG